MFALEATKQARPPTGAVTEPEACSVGVVPLMMLLPYLDWSRDKTEGGIPMIDGLVARTDHPYREMSCHQLLCLLVLTSCSMTG